MLDSLKPEELEERLLLLVVRDWPCGEGTAAGETESILSCSTVSPLSVCVWEFGEEESVLEEGLEDVEMDGRAGLIRS